MTACVNRKHSRRVAAVISASLVGALSLGVAPVAAMANEGGIEVLTAGDIEDVAAGEITKARDNNNKVLDLSQEVTFAWDGEDHFVVPTEVSPKYADPMEVSTANGLDWGIYQVNEAGTDGEIDGENVKWVGKTASDAGTYYVAVFKTAGNPGGPDNCALLKFSIVDETFESAYVCDGTDKDDKTIEYTGKQLAFSANDFSLVINGAVVKSGDPDLANVKVYKAGDASHTNVYAQEAGDYYIEGTYKGTPFSVDFKVAPLDLASADISLNEKEYATTSTALPSYVDSLGEIDSSTISHNKNITTITADNGEEIYVELTFISTDSAQKNPSQPLKGSYTYKITAYKLDEDGSREPSSNVFGEREITVVRYAKPAYFEYDHERVYDGMKVEHFNPALVVAREKQGGKALDGVEISYEKMNADGSYSPCEASEITRRGQYKANIVAVDNDYGFGGETSVVFSVNATDVYTADVFVLYDGDVIDDAASDVYNGSDFLELITVDAEDQDGNAVSADEFEITVTKDDEEVDSIVDAGTYTITVDTKADSLYQINGKDNSVTFTVDPVDTSDKGNAQIRFAGTIGYGYGTGSMYAYTGKAVVPTFEYDLNEKGTKYEKPENWIALPDTAYTTEYEMYDEENDKWVDVNECVDEGKYRVILTDVNADGNYYVDNTLEFWITAKRVFADVANNEWYSEWVYTATSWGYSYMNGYAGTQFFGPNDSIKRGDVAVTLFKMAGGTLWVDSEEGKDEPAKEFDTPFSDVDSSMYYAQAIQWAQKAGIVKGDEGTDKFRPEDTISRQELAVMLARYAKMTGVDTAADASALEGYTDASAVADYAADSVAWAVEAEVMGQGVDALRPTDSITRAEVAAMTVRVQPDGRLNDFDFIL